MMVDRKPYQGTVSDEAVRRRIERIKNLTGCENYYNAARLYAEFLHYRQMAMWQQKKSGCDVCEPSYAEFCLEMESTPDGREELRHLTNCPDGTCPHSVGAEQARKNIVEVTALIKKIGDDKLENKEKELRALPKNKPIKKPLEIEKIQGEYREEMKN